VGTPDTDTDTDSRSGRRTAGDGRRVRIEFIERE
jgi:hypothetical protein